MSTDDCAIQSEIEVRNGIHVGAPYGFEEEIPENLRVLLALIDGKHWPLQVEGDTGIGTGARAGEGATIPGAPCGSRIRALDPGPIPDGVFPDYPNYTYPGVGVTAYGCQMNCNYIIVGNLGASIIVGKIDGQWHILRVIVSASTTPLFGSSNACRCCGDALKDKKLRARVLHVSSSGGDYRACDEFRLDPLSTERGYNPMQITLSCGSTAESVLEDITDWSARAFGSAAVITSLYCCTAFEDNCTRVVSGYGEDCNCNSDETSGSGAADCRFEATIEFTHLGIDYVVLIYQEVLDADDDPCTEFADVFIENVIAEAAGLPDLQPDDRVIMARIPGGLAGRTALDGTDPIEWFIIRACNINDCLDDCDPPPVFTSRCCGKPCNELPASLSATIEILDTDCICTSGTSFGATLVREATDPDADCSGAANIIWVVVPTTTTVYDEIAGCIHDPGGIPPTKVRLANLELKCADSRPDACGGPSELGPSFILTVWGFGTYASTSATDVYNATQDQTTSCCSPIYSQFEVTGAFCFGAGASPVIATTTLRITITG